MNAKEFLESKNIKEPTYEGVRLVDNKMSTYRIVELLEEYHQSKLKLLGIADVVGRSGQLCDNDEICAKAESGLGRCEEQCDMCKI
jgi:hypothetical protein